MRNQIKKIIYKTLKKEYTISSGIGKNATC